MGDRVTVRFWAAAADAAGVRECDAAPGSLAEIAATLDERFGASFAALRARCAWSVDGEVTADDRTEVGPGSTVEVLPPFSGG